MPNIKHIILIFLSLCLSNLYAQKTPQELGEVVFNVLKNKNFQALDSLTPKTTEILDILKAKYPTVKFDTTNRFLKKYEHHNQRFKKKCEDIRNDTTEVKINWEKSKLTKVDFFEKPRPYQDTSKTSKPLLVNYLDLHIASGTSTLILEFKEIYFHKGIWKLGEHVRGKRP